MSYQKAIKCFDENVSYAARPGHDPTALAQFNLNQGLAAFVEAVRTDLADLGKQVQVLRTEMSKLRGD